MFQEVGNSGEFTDYRAGLKQAATVFSNSPDSRTQIIVLLSDGKLEPNLKDAAYAPQDLLYRSEITTASGERRKQIQNKYRERTIPIARQIIFQEIVPDLQRRHIQIFSVALGSAADMTLIADLADQTTSHPGEVHSFKAAKATDLLSVFGRLLQYWSQGALLRSDEGGAAAGRESSLRIDEYVRDPKLLLMADGTADLAVTGGNGMAEQPVPGFHRSIFYYELTGQKPPAEWRYSFRTGQGRFQAVWLGHNILTLDVSNLRDQYEFGDTVAPRVALRVGGKPAPVDLLNRLRVVADISGVTCDTSRLTTTSVDTQQAFGFSYVAKQAGRYNISFVAEPRDSLATPVLPRPSVQYQFVVLPSLHVTPRRFHFSDVSTGVRLELPCEIHSGLTSLQSVRICGGLTETSWGAPADLDTMRLPRIVCTSVDVIPGQIRPETVYVDVSKAVRWGYYSAAVVFSVGGGEQDSVLISIHIPSLWERMRIWVVVLIIVLVGVLAILVYLWGFLESPSGVLMPVEVATGETVLPVRLSHVYRGIWGRWFNWRRNRLTIGRRDVDICYAMLPDGLIAELAFYRVRRAYIRNLSTTEDSHIIGLEEERVGVLKCRSGRSLKLRNGSIIQLSGLKLRYVR